MSLFNFKITSRGRRSKGFSLIETVIYIGILAMLTVVIVNTLLILTRSWSTIKVEENLAYASSDSLGRMTVEIRNAQSISSGSSVFDTNPGELSLNTTDSSGDPILLSFFLDNGILEVQQGSDAPVPLFPSYVTATSLVFRHITDPESDAVKIEMTLQSTDRGNTETKDFYTTISLRNEYKN